MAYWLNQHGFARWTVAERAPSLRTGGQAVDFRDQALTVLDRMGLLEAGRRNATPASATAPSWTPRVCRTPSTPSVLYAGELEVLIDELIEILHDRAAQAGVEYRFGDSITTLEPDDDGGNVSFEHAPPQRFDLVIGADGVHSTVLSADIRPRGGLHPLSGLLLRLPGYDGLRWPHLDGLNRPHHDLPDASVALIWPRF